MNSSLNRLLDDLRAHGGALIHGLKPAPINRYVHLQQHLLTTDVATDEDYQRVFNAFYRVQRRPEAWYSTFFGLLEAEKRNRDLSFADVLLHLYAQTGRVEASFASKLVATVRPEMPVYDRFVRQNLGLRVPGQQRAPEARILGFIATYAELQQTVSGLIDSAQFHALKVSFDNAHPAYAGFTDTKKLDLVLWQFRRSGGSASDSRG